MDKREARFDGWLIDFDSGEITKLGSTHRLQDQPLRILEELVKRPGELVTRELLISRLWPTGVVEFDTGLNSAMRKLRIALGDDAETPRYIETLPRRGYRFIGKLESESGGEVRTASAEDAGFDAGAPAGNGPGMGVRDGAGSSPTGLSTRNIPTLPSDARYTPTTFETGPVIGRRASDRRAPMRRLSLGIGSLVLAAVLVIVVWRMPGKLFQVESAPAPLPTIVVLPLVDMSMDQNEQALCDGLTEELSNWLAHIPTLRVVARTSAFAFKGQNTDVRTIGKALGATHVLEGSLRRSGSQLRVTVQLIAAETGLHIWSRSFDLPMGDVFLIEDTVSRSVAEALHLELSSDTAERWAERKYDSAESLEYYLLGKQRQRRRTAEDNLKAIEYFRRAVEVDPGYSLGLVGLSESLLNGLSLNRMALEDVSIEVEPLINRALATSPKLADAYAVKGWLLTEQYKFDAALPLLQHATQLNPNDASSHRFLGLLYERRGEPRKALEHYETAATLDPRDFISQVFRCREFVDLGQIKEAEAACASARELDAANIWGPLATSFIARARGDLAGALEWIDRGLRQSPNEVTLASQKVELLIALGRIADARAEIDKVADDHSFYLISRKGGVVLAEHGPAGLKAWIAKQDLPQQTAGGADLVDLAWLQFMAGDGAAARTTFEHAERVMPLATADLYDASQIRHAYSPALLRAGVELSGGGDRSKALAILAKLDRMLAKYRDNGGEHFGAWMLHAESLALQGKPDEAAAELREAYKRGWRPVWPLDQQPYLQGVDVSWLPKQP